MSADIWWTPENPDGDMSPILEASIELERERRAASIARHPSGKAYDMPTLTAADRCDRCGAAAVVRVGRDSLDLDLCGHDWRKHGADLYAAGWRVICGSPDTWAGTQR